MKKIALTAIAAFAALSAMPAMAATIVSENFEGTAPGFTFDTTNGNVGIANGGIYAPCCGTDPTDANNFVAFGGGPPGSGTLSTSFKTVPSGLYTVAFDYSALGGGSEALNFYVNNVLAYSVSPVANNRPITFTSGSFVFAGLGGNTTLSISSAGTFGVDSILDNLNVTGPVPEPATWAMMLLGFGMVGFGLRASREGKSRRRLATADLTVS